MTISANSLKEDVARYLSDFDEDESYIHWSEADLLTYFKRAVGIISMTKKDRFIKRTTIKLKPGAMQEVPDNCESDISVQGLSVDGVVQERVRRSNLSKFPPLGRKMCKTCSKGTGYKLKSFDFATDDGRTIIVDPPVPEDADAELVISCYTPPEITGADSEVSLGSDLEAVVFELMLYYAWGVDIEDTASRERSNQHWANAMTLLKLNTQMAQLARSMR